MPTVKRKQKSFPAIINIATTQNTKHQNSKIGYSQQNRNNL